MTNVENVLTGPGGLATRLLELRRGTSLTGVAFATKLGWQQSKVSRIENGRQMPSSEDVIAWVNACDGNPDLTDELLTLLADAQSVHRDWRLRAKLGQVAIQRDHDELGRAASVVRNVETAWIPGLLQTADYARARISENARVWGIDTADVDDAVMARMHRQQILYDAGRRFEFVMTEAVLRLLLCPPTVMRVQLDRLLSLSGLPNVTLGIIPFGTPLDVTPQHGFVLYDDLAVVEVISTEFRFIGDQSAKYAVAMDRLLAEAVTGDEARRLIVAAMEALPAA